MSSVCFQDGAFGQSDIDELREARELTGNPMLGRPTRVSGRLAKCDCYCGQGFVQTASDGSKSGVCFKCGGQF